jgi:hypothetical protein
MSGVRLPEEVFARLRPTSIDEGIKTRLDKLLDHYECFKVTDTLTRPRSANESGVPLFRDKRLHGNVVHGGRHGRQYGSTSPSTASHGHLNKRSSGFGSHRKPMHHTGGFGAPLPKQRIMTYDRELKATLNKLTRHNYGKLSSSILNFKDDTNIDLLLSSLLEKCYTQSCFLDIFVSLIVDLYAVADADTKSNIDTALTQFVTQFMGCTQLLNFRMRNTNTDYDGFCDDMIMRNSIVGKHRTILALLNRILDKHFRQVYLGAMLGVLDTSMASEERRVDAHSDAYELILDLMMDFVQADAAMATQIKDHFTSKGMLRDALPANISNRARFKIKDILAG